MSTPPQSALRLDRGYPFNQPLRGWCAAHPEITCPLNIYVTQHASRLTLHVHVLLCCLEEVHYMDNPRLRERSDRSLGLKYILLLCLEEVHTYRTWKYQPIFY